MISRPKWINPYVTLLTSKLGLYLADTVLSGAPQLPTSDNVTGSQGARTTESPGSSMTEPHRIQKGHVKIISNENKARDEARHTVATGWGKYASSADVEASRNEAESTAIQSVANAEAGSGHKCEKVLTGTISRGC